MALLTEKGALPGAPVVPSEQHLSLQSDGSVKGLGNVMRSLIQETPDSTETNELEATTSETVEPDSNVPPTTPAPEAKRKIKWNGQEIEISEKDVEALAQQGFDYTKKTQALAEKERSLAPVEGLSRQIQSDPKFAAYVYSYFNQQQRQPQASTPVETPPEDPVARLKWEIRQDLLKDIQGVKQEFSQAVAPITQQQMVTRTVMEVMKDPLYPQVQAKLFEYVKGLPPHSQQMEYMRLDQDPVSYTEMYDHFRKQLSATPPVQPPPSVPTQGEIVTRTPSAPLLESSGPGGPPVNKKDARKEKMSKAKARILASGNTAALSDWIRESGISEMLKGPAQN